MKIRSEVIIHYLCSTQLSMRFVMLINVKMPTIVGILSFISMINATSASMTARNVFIFQYSSFISKKKFHVQWS